MSMNSISAQAEMLRRLEDMQLQNAGLPKIEKTEFRTDNDEGSAVFRDTYAITRISPKSTDTDFDPRARRNDTRYLQNISVVLFNAHSSFRTRTRDLSIGGSQLCDCVPHMFLQKDIEVMFVIERGPSRKPDRFVFRARCVGLNRIQFLSSIGAAGKCIQDLFRALEV